jgi:glucose-6-phosphate dehydrogenase assembly protein OpcA
MISALMIGELPKFIWWKATPDSENGLFKRLAEDSNSIIIDSSSFNDSEKDLLRVNSLIEQGTPIADLNWRRLAAWQELTAAAFDPPERRAALKEIDRVTIDYEKGNQAQALMFLGWLASRLQWRPVSYQKEGGDYDLRRIQFTTSDQRTVEAELAGIPTADVGEVAGDLISLRLGSTNDEADCCTVLCSETMGCMRMEAGGGAQSCRIQQVTPLFDQKTEQLLSQQLQRWGREVLFEESLAVTAEVLKLAN